MLILVILSRKITLKPEFSAKVFGITSKASANFLIAYCSKPGYVSEIDDNCLANSISTAPAPGNNLPSY